MFKAAAKTSRHRAPDAYRAPAVRLGSVKNVTETVKPASPTATTPLSISTLPSTHPASRVALRCLPVAWNCTSLPIAPEPWADPAIRTSTSAGGRRSEAAGVRRSVCRLLFRAPSLTSRHRFRSTGLICTLGRTVPARSAHLGRICGCRTASPLTIHGAKL